MATRDEALARRARCVIDPCHFYWTGRDEDFKPFCSNGSRASELEGAMLNAQLDRVEDTIASMRADRGSLLDGTRHLASIDFKPAPVNSPDHDCAAHAFYTLPSAEAAKCFVDRFPAVVAGATGRHNYTEWDPILRGDGAAHPAMNPYLMEANRECRRDYARQMGARSMEILNRTVMVPADPHRSEEALAQVIRNIEAAARAVLEGHDASAISDLPSLDRKKFDLAEEAPDLRGSA